ncbi:hypothetical protein QN277_004232 [Acacia crassicarpa]|uniref:Uncharacterized protein n=1 Tax=Acacia crassicarpa TaxID=499986 RepID=A0AAE1JXK2_9FABA|nr:hypothetical protein QN277_004232 [Acacia crassicarpa]
MTEAANLSGWEISGSRNEAEMVEEIAGAVMRTLESMSRSPVIGGDIQIETELPDFHRKSRPFQNQS